MLSLFSVNIQVDISMLSVLHFSGMADARSPGAFRILRAPTSSIVEDHRAPVTRVSNTRLPISTVCMLGLRDLMRRKYSLALSTARAQMTLIITNLRRKADVITNSIYRVAWIWCEEMHGRKLSWCLYMTSLLIAAFIEWESRTFFLFEDTLPLIAKTK